jgi:GDP-L-fucose synthase
MKDGYWEEKRVWVAGGSGFLGKRVVEELINKSAREVFLSRRETCDLERLDEVIKELWELHPTTVIFCAGYVGGLFANMKEPWDFFYRNLQMGLNVIEGAREAGVPEIVVAGSSCMYPAAKETPLRPEELWDGAPANGNLGYGIAKRVLASALRILGDGITVCLPNLYGPGDDFGEDGHVLASLIRKIVQAKEEGKEHVLMQGSGMARREFLFVDDAARGILFAAEQMKGDSVAPGAILNVGASDDIQIRALASLVAKEVGFKGKMAWESRGQADGQMRKIIDSSQAVSMGWVPTVDLKEGIRRSVAFYKANRGR